MRSLNHIRLLLNRPQPVVYHVVLETGAEGDTPETMYQVRAGAAGELRERTLPSGLPREQAEALVARLVAARVREGFCIDDDEKRSFIPQTMTAPPIPAITQALEAAFFSEKWHELSPKQRNRLIWSAGEHRFAKAVPQLLSLLGQGQDDDAMQDYCIAWSLGRCGDVSARSALYELSRGDHDEMVRRIATWAWFALSDPAKKREYAETIIAGWPTILRSAWQQKKAEAVMNLLSLSSTWRELPFAVWLEQLDLVAQVEAYAPFARPVLLQQVAELPFRHGTFQAIRRLYKAAEFRGDAELFGLLSVRFELERSASTRREWVYYKGRFRKFSEIVTEADFKIAYTDATRNYLRRRVWRFLRRLGQRADPLYIAMATGVLLAFDDSRAQAPQSMPVRCWNHARLEWVLSYFHYGPYDRWMIFYRLLHSNSKRWKTSADARRWWSSDTPWTDETDALTAPREEVFADLWDAHPQALLFLLERSRCAGVHAFAARALQANQAFCASLSLAKLCYLLSSHYPATSAFAFDVACKRLAAATTADDTIPLLCVLVVSSHEKIYRYAIDIISQDLARHSASVELIVAMCCAPNQDVRKLGRLLCQSALSKPGVIGRALIDGMMTWLDDSERWSGPLAEIAEDILWLIKSPLVDDAIQVDQQRLFKLLHHPCLPVKSLAVDWLLLHQPLIANLPAGELERLLRTNDPAAFAAGIRLFSALPDPVLLQQPQLFAVCCTHSHPDVRYAIVPALMRLAMVPSDEFAQFCAVLLPALLGALFRSETGENQHADVLNCLQGPLSLYCRALDSATILRLLTARSRGAQQLGRWLLPKCRAEKFSVRDWARLAANENAQIRQWVQQRYLDYIKRIRHEMSEALLIFDSPWQDTIDFAKAYFAKYGVWTPQLLIGLCDHSNPVVQAIGREWIKTYGGDLCDVTDYLLKLSQHPSARIQAMVAEWLEEEMLTAGDGGDRAEQLKILKPYFFSVLSQVNRARRAKNAVLVFLRRQALHSPEAAAIVAEIFSRQLPTVAISDKAHYLEGLLDIRLKYPQLKSPVLVQPVPIK